MGRKNVRVKIEFGTNVNELIQGQVHQVVDLIFILMLIRDGVGHLFVGVVMLG
jgi:hypothetical protein